jgi:hypothetical protein
MPVMFGGLQRARQTSSRIERRWVYACRKAGLEASGVRAAGDFGECSALVWVCLLTTFVTTRTDSHIMQCGHVGPSLT